MDLLFFRVDDRLIHGQVMTHLSKYLQANHIIVANDQVSKNPFLGRVMKMAAPDGIRVDVLSVEEAAKTVLESSDPRERCILLAKSPQDALRLVEKGVRTQQVNIAGIGAKPGSKPIYRNISVSSDDIDALKKIEDFGIEVFFKVIPDASGEKGAKLKDLIKW
jgi:mannose/fructose/N-acetylgalactosamine-specific phosphotransferase system component IIB